ncbi:MAG TPA: LysR family transcriptional regulator [Steroidobacteraceae bacterium]|jgi:DNA-binding transcriptional LysR family regulator|nr:LysR family transcriptional regulator [Steroidobacteraceae bacterium]
MMRTILDPRWPTLVKVAELGSVTRAAAVLDCAQSVISRQITQLEQQYGARMLRRTGRGVALTDFGERLLPRIKMLIEQAEALEDDIRSSSGEPMGEVRVGLLPSSVRLLAGALLKQVHEHCPQVRLHLSEGASAQLEEWLAQGRLDLSLLLRDEDHTRPGEVCLIERPLQLLGPAGDSLTMRPVVRFADLDGLPLVLPGAPHVLRARLEAVAQSLQLRLRVAVEADSIGLQHEAVAAGFGYAIVVIPDRSEARRFSFAPLSEPISMRKVVLGTTPHGPHTLAIRRVARILQELGQQQN